MGLIRGAMMVLVLVVWATQAMAEPKVPEKLVYDLSWTGISVGTASQEITEDGATRKIVSMARSNDWLSTFFPVEDRIESSYDSSRGNFPGLARHYRLKTREGSRRRDREIFFEQERGVARYRDNTNGDKADIAIPMDTIDVYGSFYYIRYLPLEVGKSPTVNILDSKRQRRIAVRVLRKERIKTVLGEVDTIVIQPMVASEGVFEGKGTVHIWLTDDERRIPVRARTKVTVGSVTATLVEWIPGK
ncbi:DUF3108 domain-containing protein [Geobacter hydrogenophilus]|uniref:DUF3108 domain-containing protein n=1 Tax=Geobacter hydrogenophilus TaxID=40983 RepID=A0A9W6FYQ6_9BACT|nr:DUF3108 domain-containing protein [Geobacter hydrogenophilus]GLI37331.1 hypothetical protein GHYDROH2_08320 [Geobacter hydrogenophilus]